MVRSFLIVVLFFSAMHVFAQEVYYLAPRFFNDFSEWNIYDDEDYVVGYLRDNSFDRDGSTWQWQWDDDIGEIERNVRGEDKLWTLRGYDLELTLRAQWANDLTDWRIIDGESHLRYKSRYRSDLSEWESKDFKIKTRFFNDPREWVVKDELGVPEVEWKIAMIFLTIYNTTRF